MVNANDPPAEDAVHFVVVFGCEHNDLVKAPSFGIMLVSEENITEGTYHVAGELHPDLDGQYYIRLYEGDTFTL